MVKNERVFVLLTGGVALLLMMTGCALPQKSELYNADTWYEVRFGSIVSQQLDYSCGIASLATILKYHFGDNVTEKELLRKYLKMASKKEVKNAIREGLSLFELGKLAKEMGYIAMTKQLRPRDIQKISEFAPILVFLKIGDKRHFAVVTGGNADFVTLADPARGNVFLTWEGFMKEWTLPEEMEDEKWKYPGGMVIFDPNQNALALHLLREPKWYTYRYSE